MVYGRVANRAALIRQSTRLRREGLTYAQIGKIVGVSGVSVCRWLNPTAHAKAARLRKAGVTAKSSALDERWNSRPPYYEFLRKWRLAMESNLDE